MNGEAEKPSERSVDDRLLERDMADQRSYPDRIPVVGDVIEFSHGVDVHQHRRSGSRKFMAGTRLCPPASTLAS